MAAAASPISPIPELRFAESQPDTSKKTCNVAFEAIGKLPRDGNWLLGVREIAFLERMRVPIGSEDYSDLAAVLEVTDFVIALKPILNAIAEAEKEGAEKLVKAIILLRQLRCPETVRYRHYMKIVTAYRKLDLPEEALTVKKFAVTQIENSMRLDFHFDFRSIKDDYLAILINPGIGEIGKLGQISILAKKLATAILPGITTAGIGQLIHMIQLLNADDDPQENNDSILVDSIIVFILNTINQIKDSMRQRDDSESIHALDLVQLAHTVNIEYLPIFLSRFERPSQSQ